MIFIARRRTLLAEAYSAGANSQRSAAHLAFQPAVSIGLELRTSGDVVGIDDSIAVFVRGRGCRPSRDGFKAPAPRATTTGFLAVEADVSFHRSNPAFSVSLLLRQA